MSSTTFDHDHWALIRANSSFAEAITYFDGDFTQVSCADAIQLFELLKPTLSEFCQCEEAAVGHADASIIEDFIYQIYGAFRDCEPPERWFDEDFTIPEAHKHVENPFSQPPAARKALTENPSLRCSIRDTRRPPPRPTSPPPKTKPKGSAAPELVLTSRAAGKQREVASSPAPLSTIAHEPEPNDDSDNNSIQIITENASSIKLVPTLGEFDPKVIGQANTAFKPSKAQPRAPSVAPTVVAKHLVTSAGLPAEDIRSLFPCFSCLARGYTCIYAGPRRRCFNCQKNGQTCNHAGKPHPVMVALDRLEPALGTTSRWFIAHLKQISRTGRLVQLHQDLVATYIQQYLDDLKEFAFEFFQAEMALLAEHFHTRFANSETEAEIKAGVEGNSTQDGYLFL
ncbi:hypothetical protein DFH07DRAFT_971118 [Mycena maculata]|uniref:Uncharacterized protein n=1 Tax=Mycena maculata TaxID=230809 RepID=A0AAD7HNC7_9AGAR|nr:hypothetical protein DFH07DRAFT_971118 [Mycena maculata]